jgi:hypothetical protein
MAAAPAPSNTLEASFCAALSARLSTLPDLQLPSSLCREQPEPGPEAIQTFLQALLQRDPAGDMLCCIHSVYQCATGLGRTTSDM